MARAQRRSHGEGSIRKRTVERKSGGTRVRYSAVLTVDWVGGTRKVVEGPQRRTEGEAKRDLLELHQKMRDGQLTAEDPTLSEFLDHWLRQIEPDASMAENRRQISDKTFRCYHSDVKNHIRPQRGRLRLSKLTPGKLQTWQKDLEADSAYVARSAAATLSSAHTKAVLWRYLPRNPYLDGALPRPMLPIVEADYWEPSEASAFIRHPLVRQHPYFVAFYLTLNLGFRLGELRGLQWSDVTPLPNRKTGKAEPHIHVQRQAVDDRLIPTLTGRLKTKNSNRFIPLPTSTLALLETHRHRPALEELPEEARDLDLIVTTTSGYCPTTGDLRTEFYA